MITISFFASVATGATAIAFGESLAERCGLRAARNEHKYRFRVQVLGALHEGREIRICNRHPHRTDDFSAGGLEGTLEGLFGVDTGTVVGHHRIGFLNSTFFGGPCA